VEGGALGVENALKTAFDWKVRKNLNAGRGEKGSKIIHFKECFHGRTGYTMSMTDSPDPRKTLYYPQFDWPRIDNPKINFPLNNDSLNNVINAEKIAIKQILEALDKNKDEIAGLIIEPIQGEGGDNHFRCEFFQQLRNLANEHEFLLIYDEVQTGAGITGSMWAHQQFNQNKCNCDCTDVSTQPDVISFGKKTQVCGIFAGERLDEVDGHVFKESSRLNSTWGGSLVDMVRFTIYLEIMEKDNLVQNAAKNGEYLKEQLVALQKSHSGLVSNVRNLGLFGAFDMRDSKERDKTIGLIAEEGAMMLGCGNKTIRFRPHLNITKSEIDQGFSMIDKAIRKI
jgi:L-lysine 6-transaminase